VATAVPEVVNVTEPVTHVALLAFEQVIVMLLAGGLLQPVKFAAAAWA
jgi:hypothetical protein